MLARYVVEIEDLLKSKGVDPAPVESAAIRTRDWVLITAIATTIFVLAELWSTGILLGLVAKLIM